jgi:hypothetical protein
MNHEDYWLDSLPAEAPEREFLAAAAGDLPPSGTVDRGWNALCATLGIASITTAASLAQGTVAGPAAPVSLTTAATGVAAKGAAVATAAAAGKTVVGTLGLSLASKSIAIGFAIGLGVLGTSHVVQQVRHSLAPQVIAATPSVPPASTWSTPQAVSPSIPVIVNEPAPLTTSVPLSQSGQNSSRSAAEASVVRLEAPEKSLSAQAEELAKIKRLLDSGAQSEALARLQVSVTSHSLSGLAEDRDALYIEALLLTHHRAEARSMAEGFFGRYPNSPHRDKIRSLLEPE